MMYNIDDIINKVKELAEKYPNAIYQKQGMVCSYTKGDVLNGPESKGCIFGQAIRELYPDFVFGYSDSHKIQYIFNCMTIFTGSPKDDWCECFQFRQDRGDSWGQALKEANNRYPI